MQTLHSVITDGNHLAADAADDAIRHRIAMISDQWHAIWCRVSDQWEAVNLAVALWWKYRMQLAGLRTHLSHINEVVCANCVHDVTSLQIQRAQMVRLRVRI